jgi:hypothetical protein
MQCTSIRPVLRYGTVLYLIRTALSDTIRSTYTEVYISHRLYGRILSGTLGEPGDRTVILVWGMESWKTKIGGDPGKLIRVRMVCVFRAGSRERNIE